MDSIEKTFFTNWKSPLKSSKSMLETTRNSFEIFLPRKNKNLHFKVRHFFPRKKIIVHLIFGEGNRSITHRRNKISYSIDKGLGRPSAAFKKFSARSETTRAVMIIYFTQWSRNCSKYLKYFQK